jgi:hypothetical protein
MRPVAKDASFESTKPWLTLKMSRSTWYRRRASQPATGTAEGAAHISDGQHLNPVNGERLAAYERITSFDPSRK